MSKTKSKSPNKSAFVRSLPENLSAKEVVSKAKAAGMVLTENYVYTIRSAAKNKKKSGKAPGRPGRPKGSKNAVSAASTSSSSSQARFIEVALDLGLGNSVRLLEKLRQQIKAVTLG
jgi:hypothetical protein